MKENLTFDDALRLTGPLRFNLMVKPAGSLCNLDCAYCYYLDKADIYGGREPRMSIDELERFVRTYIEACQSDEVVFNWHGGEPLVLGLDFYRKAVEFEKRYAGGRKISNTIQTNATLMTAQWASFLRDEGFLAGVSIDGPADIHDKFRRDKGGRPTFERVVKGIEMLYRAGTQYNLMCTVNSASEGNGLKVYSFLKSLGSAYIQFMPVLEHVVYPVGQDGRRDRKKRPHIVSPCQTDAVIAPWSVSSTGYGRFLCDIFDYWVRNDVGRVFVNIFEAVLALWCGAQPCTCSFSQTCGGNAVVEHNGDIYCCDHFVYPEWKVGNLYEDNLSEVMTSPLQVKFGLDKRNALPKKCLACKYVQLCNGECPKHRFSRTESGETGLNALCDGLYRFFDRSAPYMQEMKRLLLAGESAAGVIPWARMRNIR